jgi:hypothetical protein
MKVSLPAATLGCAMLLGLCGTPAAAQTDYNFTIDLSNGNVTGVLTGTIVLGFVNPGGSGTGVASSLTLTSVPAGFGSLAEGDVVTSWADQIQNLFTVSQGEITDYQFFASTDATCNANSLQFGSNVGFGCYSNFPALNEFETNEDTYGFNENGSGGIVFTELQSIPEPSGLGIFAIALVGLTGALVHRSRRSPATNGLV